MLEISTLPENPIAENQQPEEGGAHGGGHDSDAFKAEQGEDSDRNSTANRWPREETMALLKIRSDMDAAFRDTSPKAPLWEQVSGKLAELGYNRSAKKCKEKFENIYKYHRRTKEGRGGRPNSKTYRFFEQLEALQSHTGNPPLSSSEGELPAKTTTAPSPVLYVPNKLDVIKDAVPCSMVRFPSVNMVEYHSSSATTSSSSKGSGEGGGSMRNKKRRMTQFFEGLMREVIEKQETMQRKFMEVLDKCEQERMVREEAWKREELARIKRERELLAQERSIVAAKDEAVLAFLKKFTEHTGGMVHSPEKILVPNDNDKDKENDMIVSVDGNGGGSVGEKQDQGATNVVGGVGSYIQMSSSRWPKDEVEALIRLKTQFDAQSQGNGSKGVPLWEDISLAMKNIGYDRNAKRCKEKWENINKYFKRMKEKNKRKPEDSKTCPYYHQLEALYSTKRPKKVVDESAANSSGSELKPEELLLHIMNGQEGRQQLESSSSSEDDADGGENMDQNQWGDNEEGYPQVVANNSPSVAIMG